MKYTDINSLVGREFKVKSAPVHNKIYKIFSIKNNIVFISWNMDKQKTDYTIESVLSKINGGNWILIGENNDNYEIF